MTDVNGEAPEAVRCAVAGGIATVTLSSPENRNALSRRLMAGLHDALDRAMAADVRVIVLTHVPPAFCAGADLKERAAAPTDAPVRSLPEALQRLVEADQPVIAAVKGPVRAGGIGLMASCDLVVVDPAVDFAFTEVRIGVAPAIISVPILRRVPWSALAAPFLTGERFGAEAARAMGLVTHVSDDVDGTVVALCAGILAGAPRAVAATKGLLHEVAGRPLAEALAEMSTLSEALFRGPEAAEGMAAFAEKRPPRWVAGYS
jgi:enoyl-CoA hydratase/carnithine racemase